MMQRKQVVFIMGTGHCGSTLLDLLLGSHSLVFSVGELNNLLRKLKKPKHETRLCEICLDKCEYWDKRVSRTLLHFYLSRKEFLRTNLRRLLRYHKSVYQYLLDQFGYDILVDNSKHAHWIQAQLKIPRHWRKVSPVLIYIARDGRAVVNSYLRKYPEDTVTKWTQYWKQSTQDCEAFYQEFEGRKMRMRYEELCIRPIELMQEVCQLLAIDFEPSMLHYWTHDHHQVAGNEGTRSLIFKYRSQFVPIEVDDIKLGGKWNGDYYQQAELAIKLDLRWKRELTQEQLDVFEAIAGSTNRPYAYNPEDFVETSLLGQPPQQ